MACSLITRPTVFPRLDDLLSPIQLDDNCDTRYKRFDFSFATNRVPCQRGRDALLKDYSRFIASYTGEGEVTFQYALRKQLQCAVESQVIQTRMIKPEGFSDHENMDDYTFNISHLKDGDTASFDFGFEIVADVDNFISAGASPLLHCVSILVS